MTLAETNQDALLALIEHFDPSGHKLEDLLDGVELSVELERLFATHRTLLHGRPTSEECDAFLIDNASVIAELITVLRGIQAKEEQK